MKLIFVPTAGVSDWQKRLADPDMHWKRGRSAFEMAVCWEDATKTKRGLPACVAFLLDQQSDLAGANLIFAAPEHRTPLKGLGRASQADLWALLHTPNEGYISLTIEGKAGEPFDKTVTGWLKMELGAWDAGGPDEQFDAPGISSYNRKVRLLDILNTLDLAMNDVLHLRYQLLHRTASAIMEAKRCGASHAAMIVQSFGSKAAGFDDYADFGAKLGCSVQRDSLVSAGVRSGIPLYLGWADCLVADDETVIDAVVPSNKSAVNLDNNPTNKPSDEGENKVAPTND